MCMRVNMRSRSRAGGRGHILYMSIIRVRMRVNMRSRAGGRGHMIIILYMSIYVGVRVDTLLVFLSVGSKVSVHYLELYSR